MKNQTNTTTKYSFKTNLSTNKYYKRFLTKAVSMIAIPIMTVSMLPNFAFADDIGNVSTDTYQIDTQTVNKQVLANPNLSQMVQDDNLTSTTHIISVNLSTVTMENPFQSMKLDESDLIPEPTNDVTLTDVNNVTVYNIEAKSVQYEASSKKAETENNSQIQATGTKSASTYRYANLVSLTNDERYLAYCIIAGEVGSCSYRDKLYVAEALYNAKVRCKLSEHKYSLSHIRSEYGYEGYKDFNAFKQECINCGVNYYEDIVKAVNEVFDNFNMPSQDFILFFHAGYSKWHQNASTIYLVEDTGAHKYYALKDVPEI